MTLIINEKLTTLGDTGGTVVVDSDIPFERGREAFDELRSQECKRKVLVFAMQKGLHAPGISGNIDTFPVGEDDQELLDQTKPAKSFRAEIPVARRIG